MLGKVGTMEDNQENSALLSNRSKSRNWRHAKKILYRSTIIWVLVMIINSFIAPYFRSDEPTLIKYLRPEFSTSKTISNRLLQSKPALKIVEPTASPGKPPAASASADKNNSVILPVLRTIPGAFHSKGIWRTWEGSFYSSSPGILLRASSGLVVLNFSTEPITNNPILHIALAESNHLDARMIKMRVNMRYSTHDKARNTLDISVDPGIEYVVNSTFSNWVKNKQQHEDHGISLKLEFSNGGLDEIGDKMHDARFIIEIPALQLKAQGIVRRGAESGILDPVFPKWYVSMFVVILFAFAVIFVWIIVHSESKLNFPSELAAGQGTITPFSIGFINLNLGFWTLTIIEQYNSFWLAAMHGIYCYIMIIWIVSGLGVFGKVVGTLRDYQGQFAYTMGRILFILFISMCFFHDRFITGPYYDRVIMGFLCYPLLQIVYIALFARTSKEHYWAAPFHIPQYLGTLGLVYWYHGFGSSFLNLKPRADIVVVGVWTTTVGLIVIHMQSIFGRFFCCCCTDNNQTFQSQRPQIGDIDLAGQPADDSDDQIDPAEPADPNAADPDEQEAIRNAIELVRRMEEEEMRGVQPPPLPPVAPPPAVLPQPVQVQPAEPQPVVQPA